MKKLASLLALLLTLAVFVGSAEAHRGAGQFLSSNTCADIASPVSGYSWCFDSVTGQILLYTGSWNHYGLLTSDLGSLSVPIRIVPLTPTPAASLTFDWSLSDALIPNGPLSANTSITFTNYTGSNRRVMMVFKQATSGGPYTVAVTNTVKWQNGSTWTMTTTAGKKDIVFCAYDGTDLLCSTSQNY
jgi:hypothetical protein